MKMTAVGRIASLYGISALLASCSAEPSATDISKALNSMIQAEQRQLKGMTAGLAAGLPGGKDPFSEMLSIKVTELEKIGCSENGEKAYICDVRYTANGSMFGKEGRAVVTQLRMVNASDGWIATVR